nr:protein FAR1-RELATED SEQUENCE 5-like [Ipomoea batatas]
MRCVVLCHRQVPPWVYWGCVICAGKPNWLLCNVWWSSVLDIECGSKQYGEPLNVIALNLIRRNLRLGGSSADTFSPEIDCTATCTSNDTKFWAPICDDSITPYIGQVFGTIEQGEVFYFEYGKAVGFDVRRSTVKKDINGNTTVLHLVCSRQGFKQVLRDQCAELEVGNGVAVGGSRRRTSNRVGCPARFVLKRDNAGEDQERILMVSNAVQALRESLSVSADITPKRRGKHSVVENFTGTVRVDPVVIRPPVVARNKGRGKRLKGGREVAVTMKKPGGRKCATCGLANGHDSRNCVLRKMNPECEGSS